MPEWYVLLFWVVSAPSGVYVGKWLGDRIADWLGY